jgi:hypothetical protein
MNYTRNQIASLVASASFLVGPVAMADVVTDWNIKAGEIVSAHRLTTSEATFNQMLADGWVFEGDSRTFAFACVPSSTAPSTF